MLRLIQLKQQTSSFTLEVYLFSFGPPHLGDRKALLARLFACKSLNRSMEPPFPCQRISKGLANSNFIPSGNAPCI